MFINNRHSILKQLKPNSTLILFAGIAPRKSNDETYEFVPNRNFYYATGIKEQKDIFLMTNLNGITQEILYINRYDEIQAKWVGACLKQEEAKAISGVLDVRFIDQFEDDFNRFATRSEYIYLDLERQSYHEAFTIPQIFANNIQEKYPAVNIEDVQKILTVCRMIKSDFEINLIKKAIHLTNLGLENILNNLKTDIYEYQCEAYFDFALKNNGVKTNAFPTIAATGENATILHYISNDIKTKQDDLILFDLGAEVQYYKADISRTYPVNGKFSPRQKKLYQIVLNGQERVLSAIKPGVSLKTLNQILIDYYFIELAKIGLIKEKNEVRKYYYHAVSHHLGLDTHDVSIADATLEPGNVITVEPGLYIEEEKIGIRIEDNILVTVDGYLNLSDEIIKNVSDIEKKLKK